MNYSSVLVVTYGRSGSTLLQGVLNSIAGCVVRGENENFCHGLFLAYRAMQAARRTHGGEGARSPTDPWYGAPELDPEKFLADASALVRNQLLGELDPASVRCLGFKEIRYIGATHLAEYLGFLERLFPSAAILFLTRDHDSVSRSAWWRENDPQVVKDRLARFEAEVGTWARGRSNYFHIDYADLVANGARVEEMFAFLGAPYSRATLAQVLETPHSYVPKPGSGVAGAAASEPGAGLRVLKFAADPVKAWSAADGKKRFAGGLLLVQEAMPSSAALRARSGDVVLQSEWGLPSPKLASEFAGHPKSTNARFRIDITACPPKATVELEIVTADGRAERVGQILL